MFSLCSKISMGQFVGIKPNEVKIDKSIFEFVDKATIKLPITARIKRDGEIITTSIETAKQFKEGDFVKIELGYNKQYYSEFEGFIARINFTQPLEVECEGYSYQLRKKTLLKTFVNAQLKDILKFIIDGTDIKLDADIPIFKIEKMVLAKHNGVEALEMIKKISAGTIRMYFTGKILYAGLLYLPPKKTVKYLIGWNVIKDNNLKLREAKNQEVTVIMIGEKKDGSKVKVITSSGKAGTRGETKVIKTHAVTDEATLKAMAAAKQKQLSFNGYECKITAFGSPYCEPGYKCELGDNKYKERGGNYIVESTSVTYGMSGYRRTVGIGAKL